jgi:4-diphosphocytidyl-2-C-methyl-D-erythritol kinase
LRRASASAKINLALLVGPKRGDGYHEIATVLQRIDLADDVTVEEAGALSVTGFPDDTLVTHALQLLAEADGGEPRWHVHIEKRIPVAAGLGGGSSDAATALALANETLSHQKLHELGARVGSDVPFFLTEGPQLATGTGTDLEPLQLPQDYSIVLVRPADEHKESTASVYARFDGAAGFGERRAALLDCLRRVRDPADLALLPPNDLASSPIASTLRALGAFRADVSGAGPTVYGLFLGEHDARAAVAALEPRGQTLIAKPAWYG